MFYGGFIMARIHECFDKIIGCICSDVILERDSGNHLIELSDDFSIKIYYSDAVYICPSCKGIFIPKISTVMLYDQDSIHFDSDFESVKAHHSPIYNWYWV